MKAWRSRKEQDTVRFNILQSILAAQTKDNIGQTVDQIERLYTRGPARLRVGGITRSTKVRILGGTSSLFQGLMIRAGLAPQP
jgi:hypothetical protein